MDHRRHKSEEPFRRNEDQNKINKRPSKKTKTIKKPSRLNTLFRKSITFPDVFPQKSQKILSFKKSRKLETEEKSRKCRFKLNPKWMKRTTIPMSLIPETQCVSKEKDELDSNFICMICLDLIVSSVTTKCGHSFCEICLFDYLAFFAKCPSCPRRLRHSNHFGACKEMDNLIDRVLRQIGNRDMVSKYLSRVEDNKNWNHQRLVSDFRVGMSLDVQTKEYVWLRGVVKKMVIRSQNFKFIRIGYRVSLV
jgi:hypothetical protein